MKVAFDIDDVIFDTFKNLKIKIFELYNIDIRDPRSFTLINNYGLTKDMIEVAVNETLTEWEKLLPIDGSIEYIKKYHDHNTPNLFITSRSINLKSETETLLDYWLSQHSIKYKVLYTEGSRNNKSDFAVEENVTIFIEDRIKHAFDLAGCGIHVILMDKSWNRRDITEFNNIKRVNNWIEVEDEINVLYSSNGIPRS